MSPGSIFLSYARGDDEPYARDLYEGLRSEGYDVWFDRQNMPSRALTFLQEIRDAVRTRDRLLVILGPAAVRSDYVRAEWQAALVDGKVVTPVLRLGDYDLVPPELSNLHCPDVRASRPSEQALQELLRILSDPVAPLASLWGPVPEMPAHFQPRPDDLSALAGALLYDVEHPAVVEGRLRTTVLHGMGGVGKTVLAGAFARSSSARRVFGDGIIWMTATPSMPALEIVRSVLLLTGSPIHRDAEMAEAVTALRSWLDDRRCLIVLDNAWGMEQAAPIGEALSTVSRLLLTTRDASLATGLGANARPLDVLTPEAARRHLADWVEGDVDDLPAEALAVARETGYLPLALALHGALARDGVPWSDLLHALRNAELDFAMQQLPGYPYPHVLAALRVSVDMLRADDAAAADRFMSLAAFFWDDGVPEEAVTRFWAHGPAGIPEHRGRRLLVTLERKALIRLEGAAPRRRVRLHDLMVDFVVASGNRASANAALVDAYRAACRTDWPDGPDDGYFMEHLLDHLASLSDHGEELDRLLRLENADGRHAWFEVVDGAGRADRFRLQLQHRSTDPATRAAPAARFALLLSSMNALAANMPAPLLDALVAGGVWTPARALDHARRVPVTGRRGYADDGGLRMRALLTAARHLPEPERHLVVDEAFTAARDADGSTAGLTDLAEAVAAAGRSADALAVARRAAHGDARVAALAGAATHAGPAEREAIVAEALKDCATTGALFREAALEPLLPLLDAAGVRSALATAVAPLANPIARAWCQRALAGRLAAIGAVDEALALAESIEDPPSRAEALAGLVAQLSGEERDIAIDAVLRIATDIDDERWRADVVRGFAELPAMFADVLPTMTADWSWRAEALSGLAAQLTGQRLDAALALVRDTTDDRFLAEAAAALAPALGEHTRADLLGLAARRVPEIDDVEARARAVAALCPALEAATRVALLEQTLDATATVAEPSRIGVLTVLAPVVEADVAPAVLELTRLLGDAEERAGLLEALAPVLAPSQLSTARAVIDAVGDRDEFLLAASALAQHAGAERQRELLEAAAGADEYPRARALALLVAHADDEVLHDAARLLPTITDPGSLAEVALPAFARRAEEPRRSELLRQAVRTAASLTDAERLTWSFEAFRDQLGPDLLTEALDAFRAAEASFGQQWRLFGRARYLVAALGCLPVSERDAVHTEILHLVAQLPEANLRQHVLSLLAANGDVARFEEIVVLVEAETDPYERGMTAGFIIGEAPEALRGRLVAAALAESDSIGATEYQPANERLEAVVARMLAYSADPGYALGVVARLNSDSWKCAALLEFARVVPPNLLDETLSLAGGLDEPGDRAEALTALGGVAPASRRAAIFGDALSAAMRDHSDLLHDRVLSALTSGLLELTPADVRTLWRDQRSKLGDLARPQLLTKLHGLAPALLHADADTATAAVDAMFDVQRWWP